ncbi:unnamed protein product [Microthlaspi erraticum]|uniref:Uncharacterized protein n=1 Tax=Microthlaspi erraticum TaxID=1685480 RepID=A0A6D2KVN8_9BRAS|nr:unnamed protein product [Microthlaspi erraticum]
MKFDIKDTMRKANNRRPVCEVMAVSSIKTRSSRASNKRTRSSWGLNARNKLKEIGLSSRRLKVDLKPLPEGLRYAFLGENSTYPVIVNSDLEPEQLSALLVELRKYKKQ